MLRFKEIVPPFGLWLVMLLIAVAAAKAEPLAQPYKGEQNRQIKALSDADIKDLLAGRGWGLAKPAELNGYPGPAHVLEAAEELDLDADVKGKIEAIFTKMNAEAHVLGAEYVQAEAAIEAAFATQKASVESVQDLLTKAEAIRSKLRLVHLQAHLETTPLLTRHQKMIYAQLRGYSEGNHHHGGHHGSMK